MKRCEFPTVKQYSSEQAQHASMKVVDIRHEQAGVIERYKNQVLFNVNDQCMRLAVFDEAYRWHCHPDSDELFLVVDGQLHIDFEDGHSVKLTEWQSLVVSMGTVHRTRAAGRTVNVTFEKQSACTVFVDAPDSCSSALVS